MFNTVGDLVDYARVELTDATSDVDDEFSIWTEEELIEYINNAQQEFSQYTLCLPNYTDFYIDLLDGEAYYDYHPQIISITGGYLTTSKKRVFADSFVNLQRRFIMECDSIVSAGDWEDDIGRPRFLITDAQVDQLRVWPIPTQYNEERLLLHVYKIADTVSDRTDVFEIPYQHRRGLLFRVMSLAMSKRDTTEFNDPNISLSFSQKWESFKQDAKAFYDQRFNRKTT